MRQFRKWGLSLLLGLFLASALTGQTSFPTIDVVQLDGSNVGLDELIGQGKPTVVALWATWCQPCLTELDHMKPYFDKWTGDYGADVLAISVDQGYQMRRIQPLVRRRNWPYSIVLDTQRELQSLLGINSIPQLYILDGEGRIVASFSGFENNRPQQVDEELVQLRARR
ncbi:MAG: TlpA disulfide reductase family protein [Bacteroidota bacterium]